MGGQEDGSERWNRYRLRRGRSVRRGGDDYSRLEDDGSLTICRLVPSVFSLMINRDILENLVIRNPLCIWTLLMLRNRIQATILFVKKTVEQQSSRHFGIQVVLGSDV